MHIITHVRKKLTGFTLIELLVVLGILVILFTIVIIAINPQEQFNKTSDVTTQAVVKDFDSAAKYYFTAEKTLPWKKDITCKNELSKGQTLTDVPACANQITGGGKLQESFLTAKESKDVYITECNDAIALCYSPKSQAFNLSADAKYTKNGALQPGCPGPNASKDCYSCTFSTNEAQECFQVLNPNGNLALSNNPDPKQLLPIPERHSKKTCGDTPPVGQAACAAEVVTDSAGNALSSLAPPAGFGPAQLHNAYNLPCTPGGTVQDKCTTPSSFGPRTVAIVIAFHSPTVESDLAVYNQTYGLPPCTIANGCLTIVNQNGLTSPLPSTNSLWSLEEALDVQMAHAVCQTCKILVVETNDNYWENLTLGVNRAAQMGATAINNSYAGYEVAGHQIYDSAYNHPGIFITAATGDWGYGPYYPASSANVIAVGGTRLSLFADNSYASESAWDKTGSGCSAYFTANNYQTNISNWGSMGCGTKRGLSDVSAVADPNTGVAIYTTYNGRTGWWILGGTSASSPIVASALALQDGTNSGGASYIYNNLSKFRDVVTGSNGSCGGASKCTAGIGLDGPTGMGSPNFLPPANTSPTPTLIPTNTPTPTPTSTVSYGSFIVDVNNKTYTRVTNYALNGDNFYKPCVLGETIACSKAPRVLNSDAIGQCEIGIAGYAVWSKVTCDGIVSSPSATLTPSPILSPTSTPTPVPTGVPPITNLNNVYLNTGSYGLQWTWPYVASGISKYRIVSPDQNLDLSYTISPPMVIRETAPVTRFASGYSLQQPYTFFMYIYDAANNESPKSNTVYFKTPDDPGKGVISGKLSDASGNGVTGQVTVYALNNFNSVVGGSPAGTDGTYRTRVIPIGNYSVRATSGSKTIITTVSINSTGEEVVLNINMDQILNCTLQQTVSLSLTSSVNALPGDTVNNTLTVKSNDTSNCSSLYTISYGYPSGWGLNGIPASFTLAGGATKSIPFTITVPVNGILAGNYIYQFWVAKQGQSSVNPVNGSVQVTQGSPTITPTPTSAPTTIPTPTATPTLRPTTPPIKYNDIVPGYGIDQSKFFRTFAVYFFDYPGFAPSGAGWNMQISTKSDFTASWPDQLNMYGIPDSYGQDAPLNASYAALRNITSKYVGFASIVPYDFNKNHCSQTIYWRITNFYSPTATDKKYGPTYTGVIDCTTKVNVVDPPLSWYTVFDMSTYRQKYYDASWDFDKNGVIDFTDYWLGAFSTKFRSGGWQPPE